jgi:5'-nucleotidase / UDP-sugar diphosphatase
MVNAALRAAVLALLAAVLLATAAQAEEFKLGILHTNDHHGHLLPFRHNGEDGWGGVAKRRVALQRARSDTSYDWLTLDGGDVFQGTPLSNLLTGFLDLEVMNQLGYDAMCLGNHEFDFGYDLIRGRLHDTNFHVLSCNVIDKERGAPVTEPYAIFNRGQYRIGVIGLTTETLLGETIPKVKDSVDVYPATPVVRQLAGYLRSIGCDIVIALGHQGYNRDLAMAEAVPELDVIVGGHSHTQLDAPTRVGDVLVTQAGEWGKYVGVLKLTFTRDSEAERFRLASYENEYQPMKPGLPEDDGIKSFIADYNERFEGEMSKVVATNLMDFPNATIRTEESPLANLVTDALRTQVGADVAIFNGGNFRSGMDAGPLTFGELYEVLPYDNFLLKLQVSGQKLWDTLAYAGGQYGDGGFPQVSGLRVRYLDGVLQSVTVGDTPLDLGQTYTLLVTDFLGSGGDGFPFSEDPYGPGLTGLEQRATFALWASQQRELSAQKDGRVVFEWSSGQPPAAGD